jgi:hypothetical protein
MTRPTTARALCLVTAVAYAIAAGLHGMGRHGIIELAHRGPAELVPHVSILWWSYSVGLVLFAAVIAIHARYQAANRRAVLALAGCFPLATLILMLCNLGWFGPEIVMGTLTILSFVAAAVCPKASRANP